MSTSLTYHHPILCRVAFIDLRNFLCISITLLPSSFDLHVLFSNHIKVNHSCKDTTLNSSIAISLDLIYHSQFLLVFLFLTPISSLPLAGQNSSLLDKASRFWATIFYEPCFILWMHCSTQFVVTVNWIPSMVNCCPHGGNVSSNPYLLTEVLSLILYLRNSTVRSFYVDLNSRILPMMSFTLLVVKN